MRVCLISGEYPPMQGGVGDYTALLAHHLAEQGAAVAVATGVCPGRGDELGNPAIWRTASRWGYRTIFALGREASASRADIVHVQYQAAAYALHPAVNLTALMLRGRRSKVVVTFHDLRVPYLFPKAGPLRRLAVLMLAATADACITTNVEDAAELREHWLGRRSVNTVIPIGSNIQSAASGELPDRSEWRQRLGIKPDDIVLAYFGFLSRSKGIDLLLAAHGELLRRGRRVWLLMIGGTASDSDPTNRAYATEVRRLADVAPLRGRVLWTGFVSEAAVSAHLRASDICVLPFRGGASYRHGTLIAAIAHGLPIITTAPANRDGNRLSGGLEPLIDRENALLVPSGDARALAQAIEEAAESRALLTRLREGTARLAPQFAWPEIARQTTALYERLIGGDGE